MEIPAWMDWVVVGFAAALLLGSGLVMSNGAIEDEQKLQRPKSKPKK
ncbi:hypothetical protein CKA32_007089 [Geitlerinema sp. FC II]|nr:hypothetical protein [Baaleninema simplex]MDC0833594.1 hypothetical protein [Geitlerinema sp. CS-897]PPT05657.1 hypothetical protein CKA32_001926 [Geitlerinema sp. FC II]PPT09216.1 hypothetical protein CKA32_007089 [Geitlerinema sp. FC II]